MAVTVLIPTPLRPFVGGRDAVELEAGSVGELLDRLTGQHAELKPHLFATDGRLRSFVNVYVNDRDIRQLAQRETPVKPGDTVSIIPSIAGGTTTQVGAQHAAPLLPKLSHEEILRYSRHLILPDVGVEGQQKLKLEKDPECPVCGAHPTVTELIDYQAFCGVGAEPSYDGAEITAHELRDEWQRNPALVVVDVREPHEYEIAHIDGAVLTPLGELPDRLGELDGHHEIVTHCHHGARSLKALEILKAAGFSKVRSLRGGIDAWAVNVDPALPRY